MNLHSIEFLFVVRSTPPRSYGAVLRRYGQIPVAIGFDQSTRRPICKHRAQSMTAIASISTRNFGSAKLWTTTPVLQCITPSNHRFIDS